MKELIEAVGYLRLSREDGDEESSSITNQRAIITEWAENNGFIITEWYSDDGYSGYSMDRPDFNRLKQDLNDNKVQVIIAKHLSRIGRHSSKVNLFLEQIEEEGKRVITIGDSYDTLDDRAQDMVGINTWVNERYVKDASRNVRSAIEKMQKEGRFICQVPFGYELDPFIKGKYDVDTTCAHYVVEIFDMYLNGYGIKAIAKDLTERNVPTYWQVVKQRMERRGQTYNGKEMSGVWTPRAVSLILHNDFYIGTLTLGKTKRRTINGKKIPQKEENMCIFEDAHEPLVDKKTFKLAQEIMAERTTTNYRGSKRDVPNLFAGKLYCADCGTRLTSSAWAKIPRYVCRKYHLLGTDYCTSHSTNDRNLTAALIYFLEHCKDNLSEAISDLCISKKETNTTNQTNGLEILKKDKQRVEREVEILIEQKMHEIMSNPTMREVIDKTYSTMINNKYIAIQSLTKRIEEMEDVVIEDVELKRELSSVLDVFDDIIASKNITRKQIETIVDKIIVHEDDGLDIFLKGNLHELCTNYIQYKYSNREEIVKQIAIYAEMHPDKMIQKKCEQFIRAQGLRFDTNVYRALYTKLIKYGYLAKKGTERQGCIVPDIDKLKIAYKDEQIVDYTPSCRKLSVNIQFLHNVYQWIKSTKPRYKKF